MKRLLTFSIKYCDGMAFIVFLDKLRTSNFRGVSL